MHKRERAVIVGDKIYALSAEGSPELVRAEAETIDRFFSEVRFAGL